MCREAPGLSRMNGARPGGRIDDRCTVYIYAFCGHDRFINGVAFLLPSLLIFHLDVIG